MWPCKESKTKNRKKNRKISQSLKINALRFSETPGSVNPATKRNIPGHTPCCTYVLIVRIAWLRPGNYTCEFWKSSIKPSVKRKKSCNFKNGGTNSMMSTPYHRISVRKLQCCLHFFYICIYHFPLCNTNVLYTFRQNTTVVLDVIYFIY
jgi:hypothetical protein